MPQWKKSVLKKPKHILDLNFEEKNIFLNSFEIALADCDGVLWRMSEPIPNVGHAINLLKEAGKQVKFVTGNGMRSDEEYVQLLKNIGAQNVVEDDFLVPYKSIARYMKLNYPNEICYCLCSDVFFKMLTSKGVKALNMTPAPDANISHISKILAASQNAKFIIHDIHFDISFIEMALIHQYMQNENCTIFINGLDDRAPISKDLTILTPASFLKPLTKSTRKDFVVYGKPSDILGDYLLSEITLEDKKRALIIGDNLSADIKFGIGVGFQTLLVLSGAHTIDDMLMQPIEDQPDYYADSLGDFVEFFNSLK
ncbi:uncharacterized protein LOC142229159 [Haematobia irritans]|uniref:uncharacterized protein LOC142229159 n=1 Tax=Haematobia irritans TaxID=7368 RepID=UPI003F4FC474